MDFLIVQWNKLDTIPELIIIIGGLGVGITALYYLFKRARNDLVEKIDTNTIESYKNALEATRVEFQQKLNHCESQHKSSQSQIDTMRGEMDKMRSEVRTLKDIPLKKITETLDYIATSLIQHIDNDDKIQKQIDSKLDKIVKKGSK